MTDDPSDSPPPPPTNPDDRSTAPTHPTHPLTDAQLATFWSWVEASLEAGLARIGTYVAPDDTHDVVADALTAMLDELTCEHGRQDFPATLGEFRSRFFTKLRDRGLWYRGDGKPDDHSVRTFWGSVARRLPARYSADRPLWKVFGPLDEAALAVAQDEAEPCGFIAPRDLHPGLRSYPPTDWPTYTTRLAKFLRPRVLELPFGQAEVIMATYPFEPWREAVQPKRKQIAERLGISPKTYDTQHRRGLDALRPQVVEWARRKLDPSDAMFDRYDENPWPEIILGLERRRLERQKHDRDGTTRQSDDRRAA